MFLNTIIYFGKKNACVQKTAGPTEILRASGNRLGKKQAPILTSSKHFDW